MQNLKIEGLGSIYGGEFDSISIEGLGNCSNNVKADSIRIEGVFNCSGEIDARYLDCQGVANFKANIRAKKITVEGVLSEISGTKIEAEEIICEGVLKTGGEISADIVNADGCIEAREIVGDQIRIDSYELVNRFLSMFTWNKSKMSKVGLIEATTINLRGVTAETVNGMDITIGPYCKIENIDCSGFLSINATSTVKNISGNYTMRG